MKKWVIVWDHINNQATLCELTHPGYGVYTPRHVMVGDNVEERACRLCEQFNEEETVTMLRG